MSGAVPPPAARPLGRAARVPRPVCPGCGRCGRGDPAPAPRRAPLRAGVARRGACGRASPGGVLFAVVRGVWGQALPLPRLPALWAGCRGPLPTCCWRGCAGVGACTGPVARVPCGGLRATGMAGGIGVQAPPLPCCPPSGRAAGARWPRAGGAGVGGCGVCGVRAVRVVVLSPVPLVLPSPVLRCGVVPAMCRVPAVLPSLRASLARMLATPCFLRGFVGLYPFLCSPFSLACTFSLPPPWCVSLSFSSPARPSVSLRPVRQRKDGGMWAFGGSLQSSCNVGTLFVAASRRITYLLSLLCLRVCARSSLFAPYHGVLMSLSPYPHLFVCCLSLPMQKGACVGGGPLSFSSPCSLVGPTPLLVSVGGAGRASVVHVILALAPRAHNKYGGIMPMLVRTLPDCSSIFRSIDQYPGALPGALDLGSGARICKWVALGLKFISSPIQNVVKRLQAQREPSFLIHLWVYGRPLGWRPRRSREGCHLMPIKLTPFLVILWILPWAQLHAFSRNPGNQNLMLIN